ncbi:peptidoglycan binding protein CsiV [Gammaproteobacteria bacterium]|nr:peptidoglycan binding protein CsiV [Gammaproteobacteria bacterium]
MKLSKLLFLLVISINSLLANSNLTEDLKEYEIEIIIFQYNDVKTNENFDKTFISPTTESISFYNPKLQINKNAYLLESKENFFNRLFKDFNTKSNTNNTIINNNVNFKISNPKNWYRKTNDLDVLKKLNNKLKINKKYKLLGSFKWIQNIDYKNNARYVFYEDIDNEFGLFLKLYRSRFLHADVKTYLGVIEKEPIDVTKDEINKFEKKLLDVNKKEINKITDNLKIILNKPNNYVELNSEKIIPRNKKSREINIFIDEQRRIFNEEIHYFDHPMLGLILSIKEI